MKRPSTPTMQGVWTHQSLETELHPYPFKILKQCLTLVTKVPRLGLDLSSSYFSLLECAGITGVCHHTCLDKIIQENS